MARFTHDGLDIAFFDEGPRDGIPVLLVHGFASNKSVNWIGPGWVKTLTGAGYRAVALDNRGHGDSDKPHEPKAYTPQKMAADAVALLDHLEIGTAHWFGYSMGARICAFASLDHQDRVQRLVFGGLGIGMVEGVGEWDPIADALLAPSLDDVTHERGRMFRAFADQTGSDRMALAACIRSSRTLLTPDDMAKITAPTLIGVGTRDDIAGAPQPLADMMPDARTIDIERRDHMLAVGDPTFKRAVVAFLGEADAS
ncbi:MAG: alpha/beta hydrolase [Phyllobacteriaceae bacterium]|jgi:pimeloyl-ACP methyl ester carboxylesterase|nr:alpha/beta hydrolase [Phyllobacteriaceae bacterium]